MCDNDVVAIVVDNGSGMCKAGFAGDNAPRVVFPSVVASPHYQGGLATANLEGLCVGDEAWSNRGLLKLQFPIECGFITNWDDMEKVRNME